MSKMLRFFIGLSLFFTMNAAHSIESGFHVRKKVVYYKNGRKQIKYVKIRKGKKNLKTYGQRYKYISSRGPWRKVKDLKTNKTYYVWHKAITARDRKRASRTQKTVTRKRKSLHKASFNVSKYGLRKNFNIRKSPNGRQLKEGRRRVTTTHDDFQMTGKFKYSSKGAKWYQVRNANGQEGYVHQSALTKNKELMPLPLPAPKQRVENFAKKESSYENLIHKASYKPGNTGEEDPAVKDEEIAANTEKEQLKEEIKPEAKKVDSKKIGFLSGYNIRSDKTTDSPSLGLTDTNDFQPTGISEIGSNGKDTWIQAKDSHGRTGWVHSDGATHRSNRLKEDSVSQESNDQNSEITEGETSEKEEPVIEDKGASNVATLTKCQFQSPRIQKSCRSTCNFGKDKTRTNNCIKFHSMVARKKLPLNAALYSIKTWKQTTGKYCDGQSIKNKVRNKCSFMFSDLDRRPKVKRPDYRSPAYFVDLCAGDSKKTNLKDVVNFTTTKRGTGTGVKRSSARYTDRNGAGTTLAGVFRTGNLTPFTPFKKSRGKYKRRLGWKLGDRRCNDTWSKHRRTTGSWANKFKSKGKWVRNPFFKHCPAIRLGMHRIGGAATDGGKPMHTSPFNSSSGCPSVDKKDNWMVRKLAQGGVSLYIAYTNKRSEKKHFKEPAKQCKGDADAHNPLLAGQSF